MFRTIKAHRSVVRLAADLAALMLSSRESWEQRALQIAKEKPHLFPGMLVQARIAIDDLKVSSDVRVSLIDKLGAFRDSLAGGRAPHWEQRREAAVVAAIAAQRSPPVRSAVGMALQLETFALDPIEAAIVTLDAWNVMIREGWYMDSVGLLTKVIRGAAKRPDLFGAQS